MNSIYRLSIDEENFKYRIYYAERNYPYSHLPTIQSNWVHILICYTLYINNTFRIRHIGTDTHQHVLQQCSLIRHTH